jgi:hypothetical protein
VLSNRTVKGLHHETKMAKASLTPAGSDADSPAPPLRPSPATGHAADMLVS